MERNQNQAHSQGSKLETEQPGLEMDPHECQPQTEQPTVPQYFPWIVTFEFFFQITLFFFQSAHIYVYDLLFHHLAIVPFT